MRTPTCLASLVLATVSLTGASAIAQTATDEESYTRTVEASFDDVAFSVEQAITNEGLVIDLTSHVGDMLARTKEDVGGEMDLFTHARIFSFCSAKLSREVIEADVTNIRYCPYSIFVYETPDAVGQVTVGYRAFPSESMAPVNELLTRLVDAGTE